MTRLKDLENLSVGELANKVIELTEKLEQSEMYGALLQLRINKISNEASMFQVKVEYEQWLNDKFPGTPVH